MSAPDCGHVEAFVVDVTIAEKRDRSALLSMASVLQRRNVDVVDAVMTRAEGGRQKFRATFNATPIQATLVARSMENLVHVLGAVLVDE